VQVVFETHAMTVDNENGIATGWLPGELSGAGLENARELGLRRDVTAGVASLLGERSRDRDGQRVLLVGHAATRRLALDHLLSGRRLEAAVVTPFDQQEGWTFELTQRSTGARVGCFMNALSADRGGIVEPLAGDTGADPGNSAGRLVELRGSAKGWHGVQLAVLGFIGLCGVLQGAAGQDGPHWLQVLAGVLVVIALVLACGATALVATAAWPVHEIEEGLSTGADAEQALHHTARRLRLGIMITFAAVVVLALGATTSWWPEQASSAAGAARVEVTTSQGSACGQLQDGDPGTIAVQSARGLVVVATSDVVRLRLVASCG
jgi:hypothetical protein